MGKASSERGVAYVFGPFRFVPGESLLLREGEPATLTPRAFDLLRLLVESAGHLKSRDELIEALWPTTVVGENSLAWNVSAVRRALGDDRAAPRYIETVPRRGYRFIAPVEVKDPGVHREGETGETVPPGRWPWVAAGGLIAAAGVVIALAMLWPGSLGGSPTATTAPQRASIAVLPFENLNLGKKDAYFTAGMQEMILTRLAEIGGLKVISRTSTATYQSHPEDLKRIGRQLGVANLLEGSVQKAGNQVLINVQLIDARTHRHLWAQSYQRTLNNIFGVEGEVAEKVAAALRARLDPAERARVTTVPTRNPAAYDAYLRGLSLETNTSAFQLTTIAAAYRRAVKLDPSFAMAWARLASVKSLRHFTLFDYTPAHPAQAKAALGRAQALAPDAVATQIAEGDYAFYVHYDYPKAIAAYRRVLNISPSSAAALANLGYIERREGHWQRAIDYMKRSLALDPRNVQTLTALGFSYACLHRLGRARESFKRALAINPSDSGAMAMLAMTYDIEGKLAQARNIIANISPSDWSVAWIVVWHALLSRRYADAIKLLRVALANGKHMPEAMQGRYYELLGFAEDLAGKHGAARRAYAQSITAWRAAPQSAVALIMQANAQASLGRKAAAMATVQQARATASAMRNAFSRPLVEFFLAAVQTRLGKRTQAIAILHRLLAAPLGSVASVRLTPALLRLDPTWDPLRNDPRFQALLNLQATRTPSGTTAD